MAKLITEHDRLIEQAQTNYPGTQFETLVQNILDPQSSLVVGIGQFRLYPRRTGREIACYGNHIPPIIQKALCLRVSLFGHDNIRYESETETEPAKASENPPITSRFLSLVDLLAPLITPDPMTRNSEHTEALEDEKQEYLQTIDGKYGLHLRLTQLIFVYRFTYIFGDGLWMRSFRWLRRFTVIAVIVKTASKFSDLLR